MGNSGDGDQGGWSDSGDGWGLRGGMDSADDDIRGSVGWNG